MLSENLSKMYLADLEIGFDAEKASYFASPNLEGIMFLMTFGKVTVGTFCTFKLNRYVIFFCPVWLLPCLSQRTSGSHAFPVLCELWGPTPD